MLRCRRLHRHRYARHPHVLLVVTVGYPQVAVGRCSVALQYAACVLRAETLVQAIMTLGRHLTVHKVERGIFQSVAAQRYCQRPAVFRRVIHRCVCAVAEALSPYLGVGVYKSRSTEHRLAPCVSAVGTDACQGVLPHSHLAPVGQGVAAESLVRSLQRQYLVVAVGLLSPLHAVHRVCKNLVARLYKSLVLGALIVRIVGVFLAEAVVVVDEINRSERSVLPYLAYHAPYAVAVVRVVFGRYRHSIVAHGNQFAAL